MLCLSVTRGHGNHTYHCPLHLRVSFFDRASRPCPHKRAPPICILYWNSSAMLNGDASHGYHTGAGTGLVCTSLLQYCYGTRRPSATAGNLQVAGLSAIHQAPDGFPRFRQRAAEPRASPGCAHPLSTPLDLGAGAHSAAPRRSHGRRVGRARARLQAEDAFRRCRCCNGGNRYNVVPRVVQQHRVLVR